jgi:hypothetical protein
LILDTQQYKYDIAFSFLAQDEPIANELNDLLQDRLRTFLYSKKQGEIAGTDGEKTFNSVFGEQARLVVVLYRNGWGQTPWTRIEETSIRNRAFDQGYEFVKFIPLDDHPTVPKWLPRTQLWLGLNRWGVAGAASVIEARVEELGGEPREETVAERAARLDRSLRFSERRHQFLTSYAGVKAANEEFEALGKEIERLIALIGESLNSISLSMKTAPRQIVVLGLGVGLSIDWQYTYSNTLDDAKLTLALWNGHPPFQNNIYRVAPRKLWTETFILDLLPTERLCWTDCPSRSRTYETKELGSYILKYYLDQADPNAKRYSREK